MTQDLNSIPLDPMALPLHGTRLIEASAGTGKTYTIAALYLRLVLGHGGENAFLRPLTPPEILVVTFTNAATEELRDRIRTRLLQAAGYFRGEGEGDVFLALLKSEYTGEELPGKARLLEEAARWMDESAVYTIHAWCHRMLHTHAFDSGSLFELALETDDGSIFETAACDYWRTHFYALPVDELNELLSCVKLRDPFTLLEKVRPFFSMDAVDDIPDSPFDLIRQRHMLIERARRCWASDFSGAVDALRRAQKDKSLNGNKYRKASLENWIDEMKCWVEDRGPLPGDKILEKFSAAGLAAGVSKKGVPPVHAAYDALDALRDELGGMDIDAALSIHAAAEIRERVALEKERLSLMGFDDLLTRLGTALEGEGGERLAEVIRREFPVVMIDEFQDTDPLQYASFSRIYSGRADLFFLMIGDPKQAIYAFRGADIHTYLAARQSADGAVYHLARNYRSTKGAVDAVNRIFSVASDYPEGPFLFRERIPFEPVSAQGTHERLVVDGKPVKALNLCRMEQDEPVNKTGEGGYISRMADAAASEIVRLLNLGACRPPRAGFQACSMVPTEDDIKTDDIAEKQSDDGDNRLKSLRPSDIAILVRSGDEAVAIRKALNDRGVSSVYLSDKESVFDTGEADDLLYLLRACAEPTNAGFVRTALATRVLSLSFARLDRLNHDEAAWEHEVERFKSYQASWNTQGVLPMIRRLLLDFHVPSRLLSEPGGERCLTNLLHLSEILQSEAVRLDGEKSLIRWFAERLETPAPGSDELILRLESDDDLIRVVTIHKSKGLEYPLVFLPFICTFREVTARNTPVVRYHDEHGKIRIKRKPDKADLEKADMERLQEDMRMLYVALTRARYAAWLGVGGMGNITRKHGEKTLLHLCGLGYLLSGGEMITVSGLSERLENMVGDCVHIGVQCLSDSGMEPYLPNDISEALTPAESFKGSISRQWWITSYSGILRSALMQAFQSMEGKRTALSVVLPQSASEEQLLESEAEMHVEAGSATDGFAMPGTVLPDDVIEKDSELSMGAFRGSLDEMPPDSPSESLFQGDIEPFFQDADGRSIHDFPRGPEPGIFLHDLLEWAANEGFDRVATDAGRVLIPGKVAEMCERRAWGEWAEVLTDWMGRLLTTPLNISGFRHEPGLALADLSFRDCRAEMEFMFSARHVHTGLMDSWIQSDIFPADGFPGLKRPMLKDNRVHGMLKGFIDLVFCHQGRYYVMDYKSNYLGKTPLFYGRETMLAAMLEHRYDLQYVLYILALHRLLKSRLKDYDYDRDVGGAVYLFLRGVDGHGHGVFADRPPCDLIQRLDDYFSGEKGKERDAE